MTPSHDFMRALRRQPTQRTPAWIMRQAGRYLPEYRAVRERAGSFMTLCQTPELACEVTLQPLARYDLDAAILFSDILTIPDALGLGLRFEEGHGPIFDKPLQTAQAIVALEKSYPHERLAYVPAAVAMIQRELAGRRPLIGFAGSPWTLACYMIHGRGSRDFAQAKRLLYAEPGVMRGLLETLASHISCYLKAQIAAGVDAVMLFDTWGGLLPTADYISTSLFSMQHIVESIRAAYPETPIILFTKGGGQWLSQQMSTGADALGVDWTVDLATAFLTVGGKIALQGNLDPSVLLAPPPVIHRRVRELMATVPEGSHHIFNLGHGITPEVPVEHVQVLLEAVHLG